MTNFRFTKFIPVTIIMLSIMVLVSPRVKAEQDFVFETQKMEIINASGEKYLFKTEIADTNRLRARGLQFRTSLPIGSAMLFDFKTTKPVNFWMKNTAIPLDMLFVTDQGVISRIVENTTPFSLDIIPSNGQVRSVIEVRAGTAQKLNIKVGDRVKY